MNYYLRYYFLFFNLLLFSNFTLQAQFQVANVSAEEMVEDIFLAGNCVEILNIDYTGDNNSKGYFSGGLDNIGLEEGILLTTGNYGNIDNGPGAFASNGTSGGGDGNLNAIIAPTLTDDAAVLEFDFIPTGNTVVFNYVFASEEYPEYSCAAFNDVFAFILSGPGIQGGTQNIARIPGTTTEVSINNIHPDDGPGCPPVNAQYYVNNTFGGPVFDGFTQVFEAKSQVTPCETYHIKLAIADAQDDIFDSAVFLEANSFSAGNGALISVVPPITDLNVEDTYEGCANGSFLFERDEVNIQNALDEPLIINYTVGGTAIEGTDYANIPNFVFIPAGELSYEITVEAFLDGIPEGIETIELNINAAECLCDGGSITLTMNILDSEPFAFDTGDDVLLCEGDSTLLNPIPTGGYPYYLYEWSDGNGELSTNDSLWVMPTEDATYFVTVSDACDNSATGEINVVVQAAATDPTIDDVGSVCSADAFVLTAASIGGTWAGEGIVGDSNMTGEFDPTLVSGNSTTITYTVDGDCGENQDDIVLTISSIEASITPTQPSCFGNDGQAMANSTGQIPFSYLWSNNQTTETASFLSPNILYTVTVTDANNCTATAEVTLNELPNISAEISETTQPTCLNNDGSATANSPNGTAPFSYEWSNGQMAEIAVSLEPNILYTVTVTDTNNCTATAEVTLNELPNISAEISETTQPTCLNNDGSATANSSNGIAPFSYEWSNGQMTEIAVSLEPNILYTVTVTDANNCTATAETTFTELQPITAEINQFSEPTCLINDGLAVVSSNGVAPLSYQWSTGETTAEILFLVPEVNYGVTVTDANFCTAVANIYFTPQEPITLVATQITNPSCIGNDGAITVNSPNATAPIFYQWSNGATTASITNLEADIVYGVTVIDANVCEVTTQFILNPQPPISVNIINVVTPSCQNPLGSATANSPNGDAPFSYEWSNGQTTPTATNLEADNTYTVTITDSESCSATDEITFEAVSVFSATIAIFNEPTCGQNNGTATASTVENLSGLNFMWSNGQTTATATNLSEGTIYTVTVSDGNCSNTATISFIPSPNFEAEVTTIASPTCQNNDGSAIAQNINGDAPFSYAWSNGELSATATGLQANQIYTVTITDANNCEATANVTLNAPNPISASIINVNQLLCPNAENASATAQSLNGTPPFSYFWSNNTTNQTLSNVGAGIYSVTVIDAIFCEATANVTIDTPIGMTLSANTTNASCGQNDGTASILVTNGTPPFSGSGNFTNLSANNLAAGLYTITVTDGNTCMETINVVIDNDDAPTLNVTNSTDATCENANGSITVAGNGGNGTLSYTWSHDNALNATTATNLTAGNYSITLTDANNCEAVQSVTINDIAAPSLQLISSTDAACGNANGSIEVEAVGGFGNIIYAWSHDNTLNSPTANDLTVATYTITATDENNCSDILEIIINSSSSPILVLENITNETCENSNASANVLISGGVMPFTYSWSHDLLLNSSSISNVSAGDYTVTVTGGNGCEDEISLTITNANGVSFALLDIVNASCNEENGSIEVTTLGGTNPLSYAWSHDTSLNSNEANNLLAGDYTISVTDGNDCVSTQTMTVGSEASPTISLENTTDATCGLDNGTAEVSVGGGTGNLIINWSHDNNLSSAIVTDLAAGDYIATVFDENNCVDTVAFSILSFASPTLLEAANVSASCGQNDGSASVNAMGGTGNLTYSWSHDTDLNSTTAENLETGVYTVTVFDENNCEAVLDININNADGPILEVISVLHETCQQANGSITVAITNGIDVTFLWSHNMILDSETVENLPAGQYTVIAIDANNCEAMQTIIIENLASPSIEEVLTTDASCGDATGQATVVFTGGNGNDLVFSWSHDTTLNSETAENLDAGEYTITATDTNGCEAIQNVTIENLASPSINEVLTTDASCGDATGQATVVFTGGNGNDLVFSWSHDTTLNSETAENLEAGNYSVSLSDENNCEAIFDFEIGETAALTLEIVAVNDATCGEENGNITVSTLANNVTYEWSHDENLNSATAENLGADGYTVTVTDENGCFAIEDFTIANGVAVSLSIDDIIDAACGQNNGTASILAANGTEPYTFSWSHDNALNSNTATDLAAGEYTASVTDANNCSAEITLSINNENSPEISISSTSTICGENEGTASVSTTGGTPPYTYLWNDSEAQSDSVAINLAANAYEVSVTDANGCVAFGTIEVLGEIVMPEILCENVTNTSVTFAWNAISGAESYVISINGQSNATTITDTSYTHTGIAGETVELSLSVIGQAFCESNETVSQTCTILNEDCVPYAATFLDLNELYCSGNETINLTAEPANGVFSINGEENNFIEIANLGSGTHTISYIGLDENNCEFSAETQIEIATITLDATASAMLVNANETVFLEANAFSSLGDNITYEWTGSNNFSCTDCPNPSVSPTENTTYTVVATNEIGCSATAQVSINVNVQLGNILTIPNAFSPNNDGVNDNLRFYGSNIKSVDWSVFNRWGQQVFSIKTDNLSESWDGFQNGEVCEIGVYVYQIQVTFNDETSELYKGNITLIR
ncbi:MAG: choice-of-anchor L domain-containing protein [Chitinophagales bacterium]